MPQLAEQKPFALVLTNHSSRAVVAMTIHWTFVKDGKDSETDSSTDSLRVSSKPVVEAHGRLLITPQLFIPESLGQKGGMGGGGGGGGGMAGPIARQSDSIRVYVDAIVFEDGEVIGPDRTALTERLKSRKAAAEEVAAAVTAARQAGKSDAEIVWDLGAVRPSKGDPNEMLRFGMMKQLSMSRDLTRDVERLRSMSLPSFYRKPERSEGSEGALLGEH
jgi:hypothetical protein